MNNNIIWILAAALIFFLLGLLFWRDARRKKAMSSATTPSLPLPAAVPKVHHFDYAIHSDYLIHWTGGVDIDAPHDAKWAESDKSKTNPKVTQMYLERFLNILKYGIWMTEEDPMTFSFGGERVQIPPTPRACFTELKVSESRKHARQYGRLGIGVKRPFLLTRFGRPLVYYGFHKDIQNDIFLKACATHIPDKKLINFFKPMNSATILNYDFYSESEWRIVFVERLLKQKLIIDPRDSANEKEHAFFKSLTPMQQNKLKYLIPLDGWLGLIIYPSLVVKNAARQDKSNGILNEIARIKGDPSDHGNKVEGGSWPIEVDLDACRNF